MKYKGMRTSSNLVDMRPGQKTSRPRTAPKPKLPAELKSLNSMKNSFDRRVLKSILERRKEMEEFLRRMQH